MNIFIFKMAGSRRSMFTLKRCLYFYLIFGLAALSSLTAFTWASSDPEECDARSIVLVNNEGQEETVQLSSYPKKKWISSDGREKFLYIIQPEKSVYYVPTFLDNEELVTELISFCQDQQRFVRSPQRQSGGATSKDDKRTSESCPMIPSGTYLKNPQYQDMVSNYRNGRGSDGGDEAYRQQIYNLMQEVNVTWQITQQAASLPISENGNAIDPYHVEPLQLVRYMGSGATCRTHHDHGSFYGNHDSEQRPFTILVYLNNVEGGGGATYFPKLGLRFQPVPGDAIIWSNVKQSDDEDGTMVVDPDMVHAGEPPASEDGTKYALNIWIGQAALSTDNASQGQWS